MALEFRCEKCGKLLSADGPTTEKIKCPYCKSKVQVPSALASLPQPQIHSSAAPPPPPPPPSPLAAPSDVFVEEPAPEGVMDTMAVLMPWVISLFFHAGVILILAFFTIVIANKSQAREVVAPEVVAEGVNGDGFAPGPGERDMGARSQLGERESTGWAQKAGPPVMGSGMGEDATGGAGEGGGEGSVIGIPGSGGMGGGGPGGTGPVAPFGMTSGGPGTGPKALFFNLPSAGHNIVFLADRSGSMYDTFDNVRAEILKSLSRMDPKSQKFHIIFFAAGNPEENRAQTLVSANKENITEASKYLDNVIPSGLTNPVPAIKRAFEVLSKAGGSKTKVIFLLTDGEFPDNEAVLELLSTVNKDKSVIVNTILYTRLRADQTPQTVDVLTKIARENGGKFKFVEAE